MAHDETKVLTAHIPLALAEKVDQLAARLARSRGWVIKQALSKALSDLTRLHEFLVTVNRPVAARAVQSLVSASSRLAVARPIRAT